MYRAPPGAKNYRLKKARNPAAAAGENTIAQRGIPPGSTQMIGSRFFRPCLIFLQPDRIKERRSKTARGNLPSFCMSLNLTAPYGSPFATLRRLKQPRTVQERCELCSVTLAPGHRHLLE